jgi:molybdenum cofactor biosynthesis enzyme
MVDVGSKSVTHRTAHARVTVSFPAAGGAGLLPSE